MQPDLQIPQNVDLLIIGGGINGAGIARDAAGRGLSVLLVEKDDLASHTSSASTKLIHGGLRYLEYGEFRLVRESLKERERLWRMAPHIIWPLRFVLPQTQSPRPAWMVRTGLFLYDHIGGRKDLPATETVSLTDAPQGEGLSDRKGKAFVYSDCWVEDARLVALNAMDAAQNGATVLTRTKFEGAKRSGSEWTAELSDAGGTHTVTARAIVNTAGPWVSEVIGTIAQAKPKGQVRLIKGSHIIVPRLYPGDHAYMLQNPDRRIVFAIPYEREFTLIGTTDVPCADLPDKAAISEDEVGYLLDTANRYFDRQTTREDIVWTYSGIRPLFDDQAKNASAVTRDYVLDLDRGGADAGGDAPLLNVFGGKITTFRRLAEHAMDELDLPGAGGKWTAGKPFPGGDFADFDSYLAKLVARYPGVDTTLLRRMARAYGTRTETILGDATTAADLGEDLGGGLHVAEIDYLVAKEWARTADDILWRRSKLGLHVPDGTADRLTAYLNRTATTG
ncbi:glycerol-3-phosphate dehydrogenase [Croceicoccus naphthovorans]|uniref:Glycerol-3-phosphate dehydrogenase n=1 Tax=Croceicoccus naphthovorans TaxID=1348774 RepID=A0A0G3XJB9_9SPHN|nr:glycerol-3-phosphate dehydrogenase [Croceicoccus naphthovorans]AKM10699.1 glycerol-3-phosphate dehydrogenase [Croceicoccus naphthovorans]MBB3992188.1 glycerol-3-phosphate dehydrogenase [Croceicoccus naphthovorans]